jgi:hypothetical protein
MPRNVLIRERGAGGTQLAPQLGQVLVEGVLTDLRARRPAGGQQPVPADHRAGFAHQAGQQPELGRGQRLLHAVGRRR